MALPLSCRVDKVTPAATVDLSTQGTAKGV